MSFEAWMLAAIDEAGYNKAENCDNKVSNLYYDSNMNGFFINNIYVNGDKDLSYIAKKNLEDELLKIKWQ